MTRHLPMPVALVATLILTITCRAHAQAYCALRDPVKTIYHTFPEADHHRSIVRTVGSDDRAFIQRAMPFTLHFNELGRHTLYVVLKDAVPLGLVHVRSERGKFGLVEVAWVIDLDMTVRDVFFQRCRDRALDDALDAELREEILGKDVSGLLGLLESGDRDEHDQLVLRSGAKTLAVTQRVWRDDLMNAWARRAAARWSIPTTGLRPIEVDDTRFPESVGIDGDDVHAWAVKEEGGSGTLACTRIRVSGDRFDIWWHVDAVGGIVAVHADDPTVQRVFGEVVGLDRTSLHLCATAAGVVAEGLLEALGSGPGEAARP